MISYLNSDTEKLLLSLLCVFLSAQWWTTSIYPSAVYFGQGFRKEYTKEFLHGVPRLPFENTDFAQVVVGWEILLGCRPHQPGGQDPVTPLM